MLDSYDECNPYKACTSVIVFLTDLYVRPGIATFHKTLLFIIDLHTQLNPPILLLLQSETHFLCSLIHFN